MHYFSHKFSKFAKRMEPLHPKRPFSFDFGDLKLRDLAKLRFFKLFMS